MILEAGLVLRSRRRLQFEIDFHVVVIALEQAGWGRVNLRDLFRDYPDRFIYDTVFGWLDDFKSRDSAVLFNSYFNQCRDLCVRGGVRGRLNPGAVETIVQHVAVPPKFGPSASTRAG